MFGRVLPFLLLVGCGSIYANPYPPIPPRPPGPTREEIAARVTDIVSRAKAVQHAADEAVKLDGSDVTSRVFQEVRTCRRGRDWCTGFEAQVEQRSKVGAEAGLADWLVDTLAAYSPREVDALVNGELSGPQQGHLLSQVEPALVQAEDLVNQSKAAAQQVADARGAGQAEKDACMAAANDCDAHGDKYCESKCNAGDWKYCEVWALNLWKQTPPRLVDARATMGRACDGGVQIACKLAPQIDTDIQAGVARTNALWGNVQSVGDRLAQNRFTLATVLQVRPTARNQRDVETARRLEPGIISEQYCPARAAFIQATGASEFSKRVAAHCKNDPPTAQNASGAQVPLPQQCSAVFATACP